jgi:hypothetical protein
VSPKRRIVDARVPQDLGVANEARNLRDVISPRTRKPEDASRVPNQKKSALLPPRTVDPKTPNKLLLAAAARNETRLTQDNIEGENTLGEPKHYCLSDPNCFLPDPIVGPDDTFQPPAWFMRKITIIAATPSIAPAKSSVRFDVSKSGRFH